MSQIIKNLASGPVPPAVATSYVTDDGTAIPAANILNVNGVASTEDNANGILARANPNLSNNLEVVLSNRISGDVTTINATPTTIASFPLGATPGVYTFSGDITAYDVTDVAGASYGVIAGIRTTGAAGIEIGTQFDTNFEEPAMINADIDVTVAGNNVIFQVTGIAATTINWDALFNYRFVS